MSYDAVVVGSGPNGLAAGVALAREGARVLVLETAPGPGGGARTGELTLPGFQHDLCSAVHPLGVASPFFRSLPLEEHGLEWIHPPAPLAHPLDEGPAVLLERSVEATAAGLGADGAPYRSLVEPFVEDWDDLLAEVLAPMHLPSHPLLLARFGLRAMRSLEGLARSRFTGDRARALLAGCGGHSFLPLHRTASSAVALVLLLAGHAAGWPVPRGGSGRITAALVSLLRSLGGEVVCDHHVESLDQIPPARAVLLDLTPRQVLRVAGHRLPFRYRKRLERYRYGPGVFKVDWALEGPVPWTDPACGRAATVHLGGTLDEISASEAAPHEGEVAERPLVLFAQPSLFDAERAPADHHVGWAYCHVPNGWKGDATERIEAQVERFAPGFRGLVLARHSAGPAELERRNPNLVGGDINGGIQDVRQILARPVPRPDPYRTPLDGLFICSSSTPPGGGVHGMCGYHAARSALDRVRG